MNALISFISKVGSWFIALCALFVPSLATLSLVIISSVTREFAVDVLLEERDLVSLLGSEGVSAG